MSLCFCRYSLMWTRLNTHMLSATCVLLFQGLGTDEGVLIEILCTRTNAEINAIKHSYQKRECWLILYSHLNKLCNRIKWRLPVVPLSLSPLCETVNKPRGKIGRVKSWGRDARMRVLPIMLNLPLRDQWEYPRRMERHFPIKPIGMALTIFYSSSEFPY